MQIINKAILLNKRPVGTPLLTNFAIGTYRLRAILPLSKYSLLSEKYAFHACDKLRFS